MVVVSRYSFPECGAPSGYSSRTVVRDPASLSNPLTGALFILGSEVQIKPWSHLFVYQLLNQPDNDVVLIYVSSQVAPVEDPTVSHHHASPAASLSAQRWRQARLGQRGQGQGQMLLAALETQRRRQIPRPGHALLHEDRDV